MLYPMFAMLLLTLTVGVILGRARFKAVAHKRINPKYFLTNRGYEVPQDLAQKERNFANLFETPPLFYVGCTLALALNLESAGLLFTAWLYVVLRIAHSIIHITYNNVYHRFFAFIGSLLTILAIWLQVLLLAS